jgi:hypothetical protein
MRSGLSWGVIVVHVSLYTLMSFFRKIDFFFFFQIIKSSFLNLENFPNFHLFCYPNQVVKVLRFVLIRLLSMLDCYYCN